MRGKSAKLPKKMKQEFPVATNVVKKHVTNSKSKKISKYPHITKQEVEVLKNWIHRAIDG